MAEHESKNPGETVGDPEKQSPLKEAQQLQDEIDQLSQRSHDLSEQALKENDPDKKAALIRESLEVVKTTIEKNRQVKEKLRQAEYKPLREDEESIN